MQKPRAWISRGAVARQGNALGDSRTTTRPVALLVSLMLAGLRFRPRELRAHGERTKTPQPNEKHLAVMCRGPAPTWASGAADAATNLDTTGRRPLAATCSDTQSGGHSDSLIGSIIVCGRLRLVLVTACFEVHFFSYFPATSSPIGRQAPPPPSLSSAHSTQAVGCDGYPGRLQSLRTKDPYSPPPCISELSTLLNEAHLGVVPSQQCH